MSKNWVRLDHPGMTRLRQAQKVTLSTHWGADADGLGSALALREGLEGLGIEARVILPNPLFRRVAFLDWNQEVLVWGEGDEGESWLADSDLVVLLDTTSLGSHEKLGSALKSASIPMMSIDHHLGETSEENLVFSDAAATGEVVFEVLGCLGVQLSPDMASWLFASVSSDTCSFRFVRGRAETFRLGAKLVDAGADPGKYRGAVPECIAGCASVVCAGG